MLIFAFWSESSRNSKKVGGSFFLASPLPSPYGSCKYKPACLLLLDRPVDPRPSTQTVRRPRRLPCPSSLLSRSLLTLDLPPLTPAAPPPSPPSQLPGVSHRHCHDFNLPLRTGAPLPVSLTHTSSTNDRPSSISPESPLHVTLPGPNFTHLCFAPVPCLSFFSYVFAT